MANVVMTVYTPAFNLYINYTTAMADSSSFFCAFFRRIADVGQGGCAMLLMPGLFATPQKQKTL